MKFINPEILWGLFALAIPILVHLFNFRKFKKVYFSNVDFLKEIKQETKSKSKLKHLLILLTRLLAIAALVLAFAQPYLPTTDSEVKIGNKAISIYIDNSFSMEGQDENGRLLDLAKNKAMEIVEFQKSTDNFQLLTNDFEGRHQRLVTKEEVIELIEEVKTSPNSRNIDEVLSRQKDLLLSSTEPIKESFIFTDLQKSTFNIGEIENDTNLNVRIVPINPISSANKYIDSVWFSTPVRQLNQSEDLNIRVVNNAQEKAINVPAKLFINGMQKAIATYNIEEETSVDSTLTFTNISPGLKSSVIEMTDFPVVFDDKLFFSYNVAERIDIIEIKGSDIDSKPIKTIFQDDDYFNFKSVSDGLIDYSKLPDFNLIILNQLKQIPTGLASEIEKFTANGGSVFIVPSSDINIGQYNNLLTKLNSNTILPKVNSASKVSSINTQHPIYKNVFEQIPNNIDLPKIKAHYPIENITKKSSVSLLTLTDGTSFLSKNKYKNGSVYLSSVSLKTDESNYIEHAIFVATLLRIAEFSQYSTIPYYEIGKDNMVVLKRIPVSEKSQLIVKKKDEDDTGAEFIPGYQHQGGQTELYVQDQIKEAGNYEVLLDGQVISGFSFNYAREESDLRTYSSTDVESIIKQNNLSSFGIITGDTSELKSKIEELDEGKKMWLWLIIAALVFLILEVLLMKLKF